MSDLLLAALQKQHIKQPRKRRRHWFWIVTETDIPEKFKPSIQDIQRSVCRHFSDITINDLVSERRTKNVVLPRQIAMFISREVTPKSLPNIGRAFGHRDHTTVLHGVRKIERLAKTDKPLGNLINEIRFELGCAA